MHVNGGQQIQGLRCQRLHRGAESFQTFNKFHSPMSSSERILGINLHASRVCDLTFTSTTCLLLTSSHKLQLPHRPEHVGNYFWLQQELSGSLYVHVSVSQSIIVVELSPKLQANPSNLQSNLQLTTNLHNVIK